MGHVRDLPKSTLGVDVEHDFAPKYLTIKGKGDIIKELEARSRARATSISRPTPTAKAKRSRGIWPSS